MNRKSKVSEIMAEKLIVADSHNSFTQIMDFFTRSKIHHLPITQNNKIIGIVSLSDVIRYLGRAFEEISKGGFHALPIIKDDETLVGIVTAIDLVRWYDQMM